MQQLIKLHYPIMVQSTDDEVGIDYEERCTIRYSAGSIIRSLTKKILRSKNTKKKELVTCLQEMTDGADERVRHKLVENWPSCFTSKCL